jgi:cytochrome c556
MQKLAVDFTATNEVTASLQAQLDGKIRELLQLQGEQLCGTCHDQRRIR